MPFIAQALGLLVDTLVVGRLARYFDVRSPTVGRVEWAGLLHVRVGVGHVRLGVCASPVSCLPSGTVLLYFAMRHRLLLAGPKAPLVCSWLFCSQRDV